MIILHLIEKSFHITRFLKHLFYKKWNRFVFYINDIKVGKNLNVYDYIYIKKMPDSQFIVGDNVTISSGSFINVLGRNINSCICLARKNAKITIGNNSGISSTTLWANESITIGDRVKIGANCVIMDTDAHSVDYHYRCSKEDQLYTINSPIVIGNDVLIGTGSIILKGVTIGDRTIIGAGSVVTKPIPSDCVAGGNPCKVLKYLS